MIQGVKRIITRITTGDEFGIYRETDGGQLYLLFVCDTQEETIDLARKLSQLLKKPFADRFSIKRPIPVVPKKKVMGITQMFIALVKSGQDENAIVEVLLPKYLAVGRTVGDGTERILDTLYYIRKELTK